jgi:hypothetical protein
MRYPEQKYTAKVDDRANPGQLMKGTFLINALWHKRKSETTTGLISG